MPVFTSLHAEVSVDSFPDGRFWILYIQDCVT